MRLLAGLTLAALLASANTFSARAADPAPAPGTAPAKITVKLPADAVLMFNGQTAQGEGDSRAFLTPALMHGYPYVYEVTAVVIRDRQMVVAAERVVVWGGEEATVTLKLPALPPKPKTPAPKPKLKEKE